MRKLVPIVLVLVLLTLSQVVQAVTYNGYYEDFSGDFGNPTSNWYVATFNNDQSAQFGARNGRIENNHQGPLISCASVCAFTPLNATLFSTNNWTIEFDMGFEAFQTSETNANCDISLVASFYTSGGTNVGSVSIGTGPDTGGTPSAGNPCDSSFVSSSFCNPTPNYVSGFTPSISRHIVLSYNTVTDFLTFENPLYSCTVSFVSAQNIRSVMGAGISIGTGFALDTGYYDNLIVNLNNGATFDIDETAGQAPEFDQGLQDFASGLGFVTPQSQTFFALILIGLSEIVLAFMTGFFGDGKWRIWVIHGVAGAVGVVCVLLGYVQFWVLIVALVLATTVVSGGRDTLNTLKKLASGGAQKLRSSFGAKAVDAETGAAVEADDLDVGMTEIEGSKEEIEAEAPEVEAEEESEPEPEPEVEVSEDESAN